MKVLLFSGGIDSASLAFGVRPDVLAFVDYGQRPAAGEVRAARAIARELALPLEELRADCSQLGTGVMAGGEAVEGAPAEHWPYRNQLLVTAAAMRFAGYPVEAIIIGSVKGDDRHTDGSDDFRQAMSKLLATQKGPRIEAPAAGLSTDELVRSFQVPQHILGWTFSCHTGEWACGDCGGCHKHAAVMTAVGTERAARR